MKFLILLIPFIAQAQMFNSTYELQRPAVYNHSALFILPKGKQDDFRELVNLYAASVGYSVSTNMIRNGSGTEATNRPLAAAGNISQSLRTLSLFDLYLTHGVKKKEQDPSFQQPVSLDFVGMSTSRDYFSQQTEMLPEIESQGLKPAYDLIAPVFSGNIRKLPADYKTNANFIFEAHEGMKNIVGRQWPIFKPTRNPVDRLLWLADSYIPILTQGEMMVVPKGQQNQSRLHLETYLPLVGELVTENKTLPEEWYIRPIVQDLKAQSKEIKSSPVVIDEISLGKFRRVDSTNSPAIKITFDKDFSKINELDLTIEFGHIYTKSNNKLGQISFSEPEEALVARGRLEGYGLGDVRVRLAFHRLALKLVRKPSASWKEAFDNDFSFDQIKVIREKSFKSLSIHVPSNRWALRTALRAATGPGECDSSGICTYVISPATNFPGIMAFDPNTFRFPLKLLLLKFVNSKADDSIENMIPGALADADKISENAIATFFEKLDSAKGILSKALSELEKVQQ